MKYSKTLLFASLIVMLSFALAKDQVIVVDVANNSANSPFNSLEKENEGSTTTVTCTFALRVGEADAADEAKLISNLEKINVYDLTENKIQAQKNTYSKNQSFMLSSYAAKTIPVPAGAYYVFKLPVGKYFFKQSIDTSKQTRYPLENQYLEVKEGCQIYKMQKSSASAAEKEKLVAKLEEIDCSPKITKIEIKDSSGKVLASITSEDGITVDEWNSQIANLGKNKVEFDKGNKVEVTFKSPDSNNCPIYQYTYEIWTKDPSQPCNLADDCKATARIQAASNQSKKPVGQPVKPNAIVLNSSTNVFTKGSGTTTLGNALGTWNGEKTVWIRVETTKSTSDPLQWKDSPSFPIVLKKGGITAPPSTKEDKLVEDLTQKGWDNWPIFEKTIEGECKTIVECLAKIDSWLVDNLKKKAGLAEVETTEQADYSSIKVFIDPGHGGSDCGEGYALGAEYAGVKEKDLTLALSKKLKDYFSSKGFQVMLSREEDKCLGINERVEMANKFFEGTDESKRIFISIHFDAPSYPCQIYERADSYYCCNNHSCNPGEIANSRDLAGKITESMINSGVASNSTTKNENETGVKSLGVCNVKTDNKVLIESEFLCNERNANLVKSEEWQKKAAKAIVDGVVNFVVAKGLAGTGTSVWHENIYATVFWPGSVGSSNEYVAYGTWEEGCPDEYCVALPLRVGKGKMVEVCNQQNSKCIKVPVGDVGPWCTQDSDYVNGSARPFAEIYKGKVLASISSNPKCNASLASNGAGIDLARKAAKELGINGSGYVKWRFV